MAETPPQERRARRPKGLLLALGGLVLLAVFGALALHVAQRHRLRDEQARRQRAAEAGPRVMVAKVEVQATDRAATLPGDVRAFNQIQLTARVSGYLKRIDVDVGSAVREGQVLGVLESPATEQQVRAARADLEVKRQTAARARALAPPGVIAQQDLDKANGDLTQSKAALEQALALLDYATLRAPFTGVVTNRLADPGALLQVGTPLVELRELDRLRVIVYVGQELAPFLREGDPVEVIQDERPDRPIHAQVSRLAGALDERTRTMLVEVWLDNRVERLVPGVFAHVTLHAHVPPLPSVPIDALLTRGGQSLVAVVQGRKLHLQPVQTGLSDGKTVQLRGGLSGGELVALSPPPELGEGAPIQPVLKPGPAEPARSARTPMGR